MNIENIPIENTKQYDVRRVVPESGKRKSNNNNNLLIYCKMDGNHNVWLCSVSA